MSATVLYMSMSLDGFIAGPNEAPGRLHEWVMTGGDVDLEAVRRSGGVNCQVVEEFMSTGAVVAGRRTFEPAGGWGGDHHDGVPIWVFSRHEPGLDVSKWPLVAYVDDVTSAMTQARRRRATRTCWSTAPPPRSSHSPPAFSTSLSSTSSRCSSAKGAVCSRASPPSRSSLERTRILEGEGGVTHMHYWVRR